MHYSPIQIAEACLQAGELSQAVEILDSHLHEHPADDEARRLRANVRLCQPEVESVQAALADLGALGHPTPADWLACSVAAERLGDLPAAVRYGEQARALAPDDDRFAERLITLHLRAGQLEAARALLATLPRRWSWLRWAGDVEAQAGDIAGAIRLYGAALQDFETHHPAPNPFMQALYAEIVARRAALFAQSGDTQAAKADTDLLEKIAPGRWGQS
ncbi:MAG TPA: tetratricopeptide repeat protein [Aggregatilineales bacterium]|nr:tetratricopeptide repeat protein [Aggregatilineales bacterium]